MVVKTVKPKGVGMGVGGSRMPMIIGVAGGIIMFVLFGILIATAGGGEEIVKWRKPKQSRVLQSF